MVTAVEIVCPKDACLFPASFTTKHASFVVFSLVIDESPNVGGVRQLAIYACGAAVA